MKQTKTKLPNFLIVGAAKSGTTSLYHYLKEHPQIYMSSIKEPKFITSQFLTFPFEGKGDEKVEQKIIKSFREYAYLFKEVKNEKMVGEASADNLYFYDGAIKNIKKYLGNVKIIIALRNPSERAFSHFCHFVRDWREYLTFEEALKEEENRKKYNWVFGWFYADVGFYYHQVKAYLEQFNQVKIVLFDDLKRDTLGLVKELYGFLGVTPSFVPDVRTRYNISGIPRNKLIHKFIREPNLLKSLVKPIVKSLIPYQERQRIIAKIKTKNLQKPQMKPETREYLKNLYREDILKLQDLIKRDLSNWLE